MANGSRSTFWRPKQTSTGTLTRFSERRIGVLAMNLAPEAQVPDHLADRGQLARRPAARS